MGLRPHFLLLTADGFRLRLTVNQGLIMKRSKIDELLNEQPDEVKNQRIEFDILKNKHVEISRQLYNFQKNCQHVVVNSHESAICLVCDTNLGWYCEDSPTKSCKYEDDDYNCDFCIYCNNPDERK